MRLFSAGQSSVSTLSVPHGLFLGGDRKYTVFKAELGLKFARNVCPSDKYLFHREGLTPPIRAVHMMLLLSKPPSAVQAPFGGVQGCCSDRSWPSSCTKVLGALSCIEIMVTSPPAGPVGDAWLGREQPVVMVFDPAESTRCT